MVAAIVARRNFSSLHQRILLSKHIDEYAFALSHVLHSSGRNQPGMTSRCSEGSSTSRRGNPARAGQGFSSDRQLHAVQRENRTKSLNSSMQAMALGIEGITVSPGYSYQHAPRQDVLGRSASKRLFREIFKRGRGSRARWSSIIRPVSDFSRATRPIMHSWSNPTYNIFLAAA